MKRTIEGMIMPPLNGAKVFQIGPEPGFSHPPCHANVIRIQHNALSQRDLARA